MKTKADDFRKTIQKTAIKLRLRSGRTDGRGLGQLLKILDMEIGKPYDPDAMHTLFMLTSAMNSQRRFSNTGTFYHYTLRSCVQAPKQLCHCYYQGQDGNLQKDTHKIGDCYQTPKK